MTKPEIILASASPRRIALLAQIGLPVRVHPSALAEDGAGEGGDPAARASSLALTKARQVAGALGHGLVIGADTIVVCQGEILGKPRDRREAQEFLLRLAGRRHRVITGVAVVEAETGRAEVATAETVVRMRAFDAGEASAYVATGEPLDKAGAYAIQGRGALLIEGIEGDYTNVVGLPLTTLAALLQRFGVNIWHPDRPPSPSAT
jgi:septum formation protein